MGKTEESEASRRVREHGSGGTPGDWADEEAVPGRRFARDFGGGKDSVGMAGPGMSVGVGG